MSEIRNGTIYYTKKEFIEHIKVTIDGWERRLPDKHEQAGSDWYMDLISYESSYHDLSVAYISDILEDHS